jgi:chemotaxis protein CheD
MIARTAEIADRDDPRLQAAERRLRESVGQADTLEAVREIVTNLLGCEEIALFHVERERHELFWSFGIEAKKHRNLEACGETATRRVLHGESYILKADGDEHGAKLPLRVLVPIRQNGRTVGVLAMLRFLPQKLDFDEGDLKVARLLCEELSQSLFAARAKANA